MPGRCTLSAGGTDASYAAAFSFVAKDDWTFFGDPGERFMTGAFDAANDLIASSQQRMIELDATGQLLWSQPPVDRIVAAPGTDFYTWTAADGTVKRSSDGSALWTFPGELEAVDLVTGNVLVHPSSTTMAVLLPTGVPLRTMPGQGTDLDSAGIVYEPYTYTIVGTPTQPSERYARLAARRYSATGDPIDGFPQFCESNILSGPYESAFQVSGDRIAGENLVGGRVLHLSRVRADSNVGTTCHHAVRTRPVFS
ncbi:MAG: hypothetical protein H7269_03290 [Cellulomonas sp.]|nr:hypothetical protein [Cellulomonas sp.]